MGLVPKRIRLTVHIFSALFTGDGLATLLTLTILEIVLGIDNLVFIAILVARLPANQQPLARKLGLTLAMFTRCGLLGCVSYLSHLTRPLFEIERIQFAVSGRDLVLLFGGVFLIYKAVKEIHEVFEEADQEQSVPKVVSFGGIILQIVLIDILFSFDSVITAVGIADQLIIMILAVISAILLMIYFAGGIGDFIESHPSVKMLALSFLVLIGVLLIAEGTHHHIEKGYVYFAMAFALSVEYLNIRSTAKKRAEKPALVCPTCGRHD